MVELPAQLLSHPQIIASTGDVGGAVLLIGLIIGFGFLVQLVLLWLQKKSWRDVWDFVYMLPLSVDRAATGIVDGLVELRGPAKAESPVKTPLGDTDAIHYKYYVSERDVNDDAEESEDWEQIEVDSETSEFRIWGEEASLLVEPRDSAFEGWDDNSEKRHVCEGDPGFDEVLPEDSEHRGKRAPTGVERVRKARQFDVVPDEVELRVVGPLHLPDTEDGLDVDEPTITTMASGDRLKQMRKKGKEMSKKEVHDMLSDGEFIISPGDQDNPSSANNAVMIGFGVIVGLIAGGFMHLGREVLIDEPFGTDPTVAGLYLWPFALAVIPFLLLFVLQYFRTAREAIAERHKSREQRRWAIRERINQWVQRRQNLVAELGETVGEGGGQRVKIELPDANRAGEFFDKVAAIVDEQNADIERLADTSSTRADAENELRALLEEAEELRTQIDAGTEIFREISEDEDERIDEFPFSLVAGTVDFDDISTAVAASH